MSHGDAPTIRASDVRIPEDHRFWRAPVVALAIGVVAIGASFVLGRSQPKQLAFSWLVAFMFFLSIALGGLFFVLTHYATKASWSVVVRRIGEYAMITLPLFLLLFIPIYALWGHDLYHWMDHEVVEHDAAPHRVPHALAHDTVEDPHGGTILPRWVVGGSGPNTCPSMKRRPPKCSMRSRPRMFS